MRSGPARFANLSRRGAIGPSPTVNGVRYGYRRVHVLLDREGWGINIKRFIAFTRSWGCSSGTRRPSAGRRRSCAMTAPRLSVPTMSGRWNEEGPKTIRGIVFPTNGHDQLATGKKLRVLTGLTLSRVTCRFWMRNSAIAAKMWWQRWIGSVGKQAIPRPSGRPRQRVRIARHGPLGLPARRHPRLLPARQAHGQCVHLASGHLIPRVKCLSLLTFNGRFRAECLNTHWFLTLADAAEKLEAWRRYYNEERPHGAIRNKVPIMLTKSGGRHQPVTLSEAGKL